MDTVDKMSLYHTVSALSDTQFDIVWKMLQGLSDDTIKIEKLTDDETVEYEKGFDEMKKGEYKTLEQIKAERR